ncbi:hypothetical protein J6590_056797 [Homalodisca vitripennis]|nr:hypothetical protein J6590_056797 [Homalodisca vitripennis]
MSCGSSGLGFLSLELHCVNHYGLTGAKEVPCHHKLLERWEEYVAIYFQKPQNNDNRIKTRSPVREPHAHTVVEMGRIRYDKPQNNDNRIKTRSPVRESHAHTVVEMGGIRYVIFRNHRIKIRELKLVRRSEKRMLTWW